MIKNIKSLIFLLFIPFLAGCSLINGQPTTPVPGETEAVLPTNIPVETVVATTAPKLNEEALLNSEYLSPILNTPIRLVNGKFSGTIEGVELQAEILPGIQIGDLNEDGVDDAAVLISENTGGTGRFVSLVVIYSLGGKFNQALGVTIDDRPVINSMVIAEGKVIVDALVHAPNDAMVSPTQAETQEYTLIKETLLLTRLNSTLSGGSERSITINTPAAGDEISSMLRVSGSMPIAPFENTLLIRIIDTTGKDVYSSGFMVQAAEPGGPATFDNEVAMPVLPSGSTVILVLQETSMADGRPLAVNSVILKIK